MIVNYNGGESLLKCLDALQRQTVKHDVIVVDNASSDGSARLAFEAFPASRIIPLRHNTGFARGFNIGATRVAAECHTVVALNPDTMPAPDFLERLLAPLDADSSVASVAGTLTFASAPDRIASAGIDVHRNGVAIDALLGTTLDPEASPAEVFGASGGAAAYRLSAFREVGGFCEPFFMYLEDVDLAWRLRLSGWKAVRAPGALATHEYSGAAGEGSAFKRRLLARNRIWTLARCLPAPVWKRDRRSIVLFDLLAIFHGLATMDVPTLRGRAEGVMALPVRSREGTCIRRMAAVPWEEIDRWIKPAISPRELLRLRSQTGKLARRGSS